jgi:hypothetical protein
MATTQEKIDALRKALYYLDDGASAHRVCVSWGVCYALVLAARHSGASPHAARELQDMIQARLGPGCIYVTDWLERQGIRPHVYDRAVRQEYRRLWMLDMIRELESQA